MVFNNRSTDAMVAMHCRSLILEKRRNPEILDSICSQDRMGAAPQGPPFWQDRMGAAPKGLPFWQDRMGAAPKGPTFWQDRMGAAPQFWIPLGACSQDRMGAAPFYPCFLCFFHHPQEFLSLEGRPPIYLVKKATPRKFWIWRCFLALCSTFKKGILLCRLLCVKCGPIHQFGLHADQVRNLECTTNIMGTCSSKDSCTVVFMVVFKDVCNLIHWPNIGSLGLFSPSSLPPSLS